MPESRQYQMLQPRFTTLEFYRLIDTYLRAGEDMAARPWRLTADAMRRSARRVLQGLLGPWSAGQVASGLADEYANLVFGLLSAVPIAIEGITTRLNNPPPGLLSEYRTPIAGSEPQEAGTIIEVGAGSRTPFIVPARVRDASQGWAAWFVPTQKVAALMQAGVTTGRIDEGALDAFEPLDCGHGRSLVVLLGVDYRVSDFGRYREIALAVCLSPKGGAAEPGAMFTRLIVSDQFSLEPARRIWGFHKDCFEFLHVHYGETHARFYTGHGGEKDFRLRLRRFGTARSFDVPLVVYSVRQPDPADAVEGPVRVIMDRSGSGEGMQFGGTVGLHLGEKPSGGAGTCFCSKGDVPCLCDELRALGIGVDHTPPAANGWTERMTGQLEAPGPLGLQPFGNHWR